MSEEADTPAVEEPPKKKGKKKLIIIILALLIVGGGGAAVVLSGVLSKKPADGAEASADGKVAAAPSPMEAGVFHDLPDILVNLDSPGKQPHFLKMKVSVELAAKEDEAGIEKIMPRVIDQFQTYLRELRVDDLKGSAGIYRLRQELLTRIATASQPIQVKDVLFREILIQ